MYYIEENNKIVLFDEDKQKLQNTITFMPQYQGLEIKEVQKGYIIENFELITIEQKEQEITNKEAERIKMFKMTRGDLFEYTIVSKGLDEADIRALIEQDESLDAVTKKLYLNRLDNALYFYRGHPAVDFIGEKLGLTKEELDALFEEKNAAE